MTNRNTVLIVDDIEMNRAMLAEIFAGEYNVLEAVDGAHALEALRANEPSVAVVLLDVIMPSMTGLKVLEILRNEGFLEHIPVVLITSDTSSESRRHGHELGVSDIIPKPFDSSIVKRRVENVIELYNHKNNLEQMVEIQTRELREQARQLQEQAQQLRRQAQKLKATNEIIIDSLGTIIEYRNLESGQHIRRIRLFTEMLLHVVAESYPEYELTLERIEVITNASVLHDVGKIAIADSILLKPGALTDEEFEIMKSHTLRGCEILASLQGMEDKEYLDCCYEICRSHHERWDGKGYPDGLIGDEIPIGAQVASIADVYDALTSPRVYKPAFSHEKAVEMIFGGECGVFSPKILSAFESVMDRFSSLKTVISDDLSKHSYSDMNSLVASPTQ